MHVAVATEVRASRKLVWDLVSDVARAGETVKAIEKIEILERPVTGSLVGLKWRETRTMFGKEATEVMWITAAEETRFYETRAESHGMIYTTRVALEDAPDGGTRLSMKFHGEAQTVAAKVMGALLAPVMKGGVRKALAKDLDDVRAAAEARA